MNKKAVVILAIIFLLIVGTLGFLIYSKYYNSNSAGSQLTTQSSASQQSFGANNATGQTPANNVPPSSSTNSAAANGGKNFVKLTDDQVVSPVLFYNGQGVTYFTSQGQLFQANFSTTTNQLQIGSKLPFDVQAKPGITKVFWPNQGDNFIAQLSGSNGSAAFSFFDSAARTYTDLPSQVESLDWLPSGKQIYYVWLDKGKATLNVGDPNTQNWKYIADMWETDDTISVSPDGRNILYYEQGTGSSTNPIYMTTPDGKLWRTLVSSGFNKGVLWSPDSQKFLFGKKDPTATTFQLWSYNLLTGEAKNLGVNTTPDKAVWAKDSQTVYAAAPKNIMTAGQSLSSDVFYKVDSQSLTKQQYDPGSLTIDGRNLFLSQDGRYLFFKNAQDGGLYYLNLSQ